MKRKILALTILFLFALFTGCSGSNPVVPLPSSTTEPSLTVSPAAEPSPSPSEVTPAPSAGQAIPPTSSPTAEPTPTPTEMVNGDLTDGVVLGRSVFLHPSGVAFWGADTALCSALTDDSGMLYDYVVEGTLSSDLWCVAIVDDDGFLGTSDGLFRFSLSEFEQGSAEMELLNETALYDGFSIYDGQIYYLSGNTLYAMPQSGGSTTQIASSVLDYSITNQGVYFTDENGGLYRKPFGDGQQELLTNTPAETRFMLHGSTVYYWTPSGLVYSWTSGSDSQELPLANAVDPSECVWPADDILIYTDTNGDVHEYSLTTGADVLRDELYTLPEKEKGFLSGNMLYYSYSTSAYWDNLVTGDSDGVSFSEFADAEPSETAAPVESRDPADFDISSGLKIDISGDKQILSNDYFSVALPASPSWDVEVTDANTIVFYYPPARDAGYGGNFVTIQAFDWSDNTYADFPHWTMAGMDPYKKYIAIFPTDVRYDPSDATQQAEFQILSSAAQAIDDTENPDGNPFEIYDP